MQKKEKKSPGSGIWIVLAALLFLPNLLELDEGGAVIAGAVLLFLALYALAHRPKKKSAPRQNTAARPPKEHSHDRLDTENYVPAESPYMHYKSQLDAFLKAGIIERSEYRVLLERYVRDFGER